MRVMHLINSFDPNLGYREYYVAKRQIELGLDVKIVCSHFPIRPGPLAKAGEAIEGGIPVERLRCAGKLRGNPFGYNPFNFAKIIRDFSPDVVHCHGLLSPFSLEAMLLKRRHHYSLVGDVVTGLGSGILSTLSLVSVTQLIRHVFRHWLSRKVDAFFAGSKAVETWLRESLLFPASKVFTVPLGADHTLFKPDSGKRAKARALIGIPPDAIVVIFVGYFVPAKRVHDLIVASKAVIEKHQNFRVILVGDSSKSYGQRLDSLIERLGLRNNIHQVKAVHRTELPDYYNLADIAVWPGGFAISIIEAMACGLPLILTKSDWTAHYIESKNGFSFIAGDTLRLSSLLLRLVENPSLAKLMGTRSRKLVEDKLNWDTITNQYFAIYQQSQKVHLQKLL